MLKANNKSKSLLLLVAAPPIVALALLYSINWPRTIFRFVFSVVAPTKERLFPSDDESISPQSRGMAWVLNSGPAPPHDIQAIRTMMKYFWPNVWPKNPATANKDIILQVETVPDMPIAGQESLLITPMTATTKEESVVLPGTSALIHLHGGGMVAGTTGTERGLSMELANRLNVPVLSVDYRLVPEYTVEEAVDDVVAAYKWFIKKFPDRAISFFGGSAGAGLSLLSALKLRKQDSVIKMPKSLILSSPGPGMEFLPGDDDGQEWKSLTKNAPKDGYMAGEFYQYVTSIVFTKENKEYYRSALSDLKGLPPCLITAGEYEVILDGIRNLSRALSDANVVVDYREYKRMQHAHIAFFEITPEASEGLDEIMDWLKESWEN